MTEPRGPAFVCVAVHQDLLEAELTRGLLEAHDIPCDLHNAHLVTADWTLSLASGGIRAMVPAERAAEAAALLAARDSGALGREIDGTPEPPAPTCPQCGADTLDIVPTRQRSLAMLLLFVFSLTLFGGDNERRCRACGHRFPYG